MVLEKGLDLDVNALMQERVFDPFGIKGEGISREARAEMLGAQVEITSRHLVGSDGRPG